MRAVSRAGTVALAGRVILAAEILAGRRVGIRIEGATLMFFDLETRELLRTRPQPDPTRPGQAPARGPTGRTTSAAVGRADHRAAGGLEHRRDHRLLAEGGPR